MGFSISGAVPSGDFSIKGGSNNDTTVGTSGNDTGGLHEYNKLTLGICMLY